MRLREIAILGLVVGACSDERGAPVAADAGAHPPKIEEPRDAGVAEVAPDAAVRDAGEVVIGCDTSDHSTCPTGMSCVFVPPDQSECRTLFNVLEPNARCEPAAAHCPQDFACLPDVDGASYCRRLCSNDDSICEQFGNAVCGTYPDWTDAFCVTRTPCDPRFEGCGPGRYCDRDEVGLLTCLPEGTKGAFEACGPGECQVGHQCTSDIDGVLRCLPHCSNGRTCGLEQLCVSYANDPSNLFCLRQCDPLDPTACSSSTSCRPLGPEVDGDWPTICQPRGPVPIDGNCGSTADCAEGACVAFTGHPALCRALCGEIGASCVGPAAPRTECIPLDGIENVGVCVPS